MRTAACLQICLACVFVLADANGGVIAVDVSNGIALGIGQPGQTLGWEFKLSQSKTLTALGFFNAFGDSRRLLDQEVAIWSAAGGAPLAQAIVTKNSDPVASANAAHGWLFEGIDPLILAPGNYVLGANSSRIPGIGNRILSRQIQPPLPPIPLITSYPSGLSFVQHRGLLFPSATFDFPNISFGTPQTTIGVNALFADVPEPNSLFVFFGLGAFALIGRRDRCRT